MTLDPLLTCGEAALLARRWDAKHGGPTFGNPAILAPP